MYQLVPTGEGLDLGRSLLLALDILRGLVDLHDAGVVVADLKPANVLLASAGRPVLADFGISRAFSSTVGMHIGTSIQGTPNYM